MIILVLISSSGHPCHHQFFPEIEQRVGEIFAEPFRASRVK
jgi:hypothetical protein